MGYLNKQIVGILHITLCNKNMSKCQFIKSDKSQCKANAIKDDKCCFWHSMEMKEQRSKAVMDGGLSLKRSYGRTDVISITNTQDVLKLVVETINDLRCNKVSTRNANAIGYLAGVALKTIEQGDLEKRLQEVEYALKIKSRHH